MDGIIAKVSDDLYAILDPEDLRSTHTVDPFKYLNEGEIVTLGE